MLQQLLSVCTYVAISTPGQVVLLDSIGKIALIMKYKMIVATI